MRDLYHKPVTMKRFNLSYLSLINAARLSELSPGLSKKKTCILLMSLITILNAVAQTTYTWAGNNDCRWVVAGNWNSSNYPGSNNLNEFDIARFDAGAVIGLSVAIKMGDVGDTLHLGAIELTSSYTGGDFYVGNSSPQFGTIKFNGATLNGVSNTIIRNVSARNFTVKDKSTNPSCFNEPGSDIRLAAQLNNSTNNIVSVEGTGAVIFNSELKGAANKTLTKTGSGILVFNGASPTNSYLGKTVISAGYINVISNACFGGNPASFTADQITMNGGGIQDTSVSFSFNQNRGIYLGAGGGSFDVNAGLTITGSTTNLISGPGGLTKLGAGTVDLISSNTYSGTTIVNAGTLKLSHTTTLPVSNSIDVNNGGTLQISASQSLANITLAAGSILTIDNNKILTITGTLTLDVGATINGAGIIAYSGGGLVYTGTGTKTSAVEWPVSSLPPVTITVNSAATILLGASRTGVNSTTVTVHGVLNTFTYQVYGLTNVNIHGTLITANLNGIKNTGSTFISADFYFGPTSTVNYNDATSGNQAVTSTTVLGNPYANIIISGGGTKTPDNTLNISGTLLIKDNGTIFDGLNRTIGGITPNLTSLTMENTSVFKTGGINTSPDARGTYTLAATSTIEFTNTSGTQQNIRLSPDAGTVNYGKIIVSGSNVGLSGTSSSIKMQTGTSFTVTSSGVFNVKSSTGFTGAANSAVSNNNNPTVSLLAGSTVNYNGITATQPLTARSDYKNLTISGSGVKIAQGDITVANTLSLSAGELSINGNTLTANGAVTNVAGTLTGSSTSNLVIGGTAGTLIFTSGPLPPTSAPSRSLKNLSLKSSSSAKLGSTLDVYGDIELYDLPNHGSLDLDGQNLNLKSGSSYTARIGRLMTDGSNLAGAGNVTVERWIPMTNPNSTGRRYQLLTSTVNTLSSPSGVSIRDNWMEGGLVTTIGVASNPKPGYGTHITGAGSNSSNFDRTQTNQSSFYTIESNTTQALLNYTAIGNAFGSLNPYQGYFLFVRGDRLTDINLFNSNTSTFSPPWKNLPSSNTTLRATGTIQTGNITNTSFSIANTGRSISGGDGVMNLVTNPYPSPIDWSLILSSSTGISGSYTYWDPHYGTRGGFVSVNTAGVQTPSPGGTIPVFDSSARYIQSGQAFFVTANSTAMPSINFDESQKAVKNNNTVFLVPPENFSATLYYYEGGTNNRRVADGVRVIYDNSYSKGIDADDVYEIANWDENMFIPRNGKKWVVESRPVVMNNDTIPVSINNLKVADYELEFIGESFTNPFLTATLHDNFTGSKTLLSVTGTTVVPISVTSNPASYSANRFMVVFAPPGGPLPINISSIKAYEKNNGVEVEWTMNTEQDMDKYEVERSANGRNFSKMETVLSKGNSSQLVKYNWFDAAPFTGDNFYRIRSIDKSGAVKYSSIVRVNLIKTETSDISFYPNPVVGEGINIQFMNLPAGNYQVMLVNTSGQRIFATECKHTGGSATQYIDFGKAIAGGNYTLQVNGNGKSLTRKLSKK